LTQALRTAGYVTLWIPLAGPVAAEAVYPARPIRIVVPQSPGGASNFNARLVAPLLAERLRQSVVIDNRPGAGTIVGSDIVAKAAPDGHTLLVVPSSFTITPSMYKNVPFDTVKDFAPVTTLSSYPYIVAAHPSVPANSIRELIFLAKARPGAFNFASGGVGTGTHLDGELFKSAAGLEIVHVPYKGGGPAVSALLGGQVQLHFASVISVLTFIKAGKVKALAVTSANRSSLLPEMPTVSESGLPGFEHIGWTGMLAPARTSRAIIKKLNEEINLLLKTPAARERFMADGSEPGGISPEEFAARIKSEVPKWAGVISQAGIQPE